MPTELLDLLLALVGDPVVQSAYDCSTAAAAKKHSREHLDTFDHKASRARARIVRRVHTTMLCLAMRRGDSSFWGSQSPAEDQTLTHSIRMVGPKKVLVQ